MKSISSLLISIELIMLLCLFENTKAKITLKAECLDNNTEVDFSNNNGVAEMGDCKYVQVNAHFDGKAPSTICPLGGVGDFTLKISRNEHPALVRNTRYTFSSTPSVEKNVYYLISEETTLWFEVFLDCLNNYQAVETPGRGLKISFNQRSCNQVEPGGSGRYIYPDPNALQADNVFTSNENQLLRWTYPVLGANTCPCKNWVMQYKDDTGVWKSSKDKLMCGIPDRSSNMATASADLSGYSDLPKDKWSSMSLFEEGYNNVGDSGSLSSFRFCIPNKQYSKPKIDAHPLFRFNDESPVPLLYEGSKVKVEGGSALAVTKQSCNLLNNLTLAVSSDGLVFSEFQVIKDDSYVYVKKNTTPKLYSVLLYGTMGSAPESAYKDKLKERDLCPVEMPIEKPSFDVERLDAYSEKQHKATFTIPHISAFCQAWGGQSTTIGKDQMDFRIVATFSSSDGTVYHTSVPQIDIDRREAMIEFPSPFNSVNTMLNCTLFLLLKNTNYVITSATITKEYCVKASPAVVTNAVFEANKSCEGDPYTMKLKWDPISYWGVNCKGNTNAYYVDQVKIDNGKTEYQFTGPCPPNYAAVTKTVYASNGDSRSSVVVRGFVCRNVAPDAPSNLRGDNLFVRSATEKYIVVVKNTVHLLWTHSVWGNCIPSENFTNSYVVFEVGDDGRTTTLTTTNKNEAYVSISPSSVAFAKRTIRVRAQRTGTSYSVSEGPALDFCFQTPPGPPGTKPLSGEVSKTQLFSWDASIPGVDCVNPETVTEYTLNAVSLADPAQARTVTTEETSATLELPFGSGEEFEWYVTATVKGTDLSKSSSVWRETMGQSCTTNKSPKWPDTATVLSLLSPENHSSHFIERGRNIHFAWPLPSEWGVLCNVDYTRQIHLSFTNIKTKEENTLIFEEVSSADLLLPNGDYSWTVTAKINETGTNNVMATQLPFSSSFYVCSYDVPFVFPSIPESLASCGEGCYVFVKGESTLSVLYSVDDDFKDEESCYRSVAVTFTLESSDGNSMDVVRGFNSVEDLRDLDVDFDYKPTESVRICLSADVSVETSTNSGVNSSCFRLCVPTNPEAPIFTGQPSALQEGNDVTISWTGIDVYESSCQQREKPTYYYTVKDKSTGNIKASGSTDSTSIVISLDSGVYNVWVNCSNGYLSSLNNQLEFSVCVKQVIEAVNLQYPSEGDKPFYKKVYFKYDELEVFDYRCTEMTHYLVYWNKNDESDRGNETLDINEYATSRLLRTLQGDSTYCWFIDTIAYGTSIHQKEKCFETCKPTDFNKMKVEMSPADNARIKAVDGMVELSWVLPEKLCGAVLEQTVMYWQDPGENATENTTINYHYSVVENNRNSVWIRVSGGIYHWNLTMFSTELGIESPTNTTRMFTACNERSPKAPTAIQPSGTASKRNLKFTFKYADPGEYCFDVYPGTPGFTVELRSRSGSFYENFSIPLSSSPDSQGLLHIPVNTDLEYGWYIWNALTVNDGGRVAMGDDKLLFVLCDSPSPVPLESPADGAHTNSSVTFMWEFSKELAGYSCMGTSSASDFSLDLLIDDVESLNETNEGIPTKRVAGWDNGKVIPNSFESSLAGVVELGHTYAWCLVITNKENEVSVSEIRRFTVSMMDCDLLSCKNGGVCEYNESNQPVCICENGYTGIRCENEPGADLVLILGTTIPAFLIIVAIIAIIVAVAVKKRKKEARTKVLLKAPSGDLRFTFVKPPDEEVNGKMRSNAAEKIREDGLTDDFPWSIAILAATPSTSIENTVKAMLYAHRANKSDVVLLKQAITVEVNLCKSDKVIFRANTAATLMFKHFSKMVGMGYLFQTLGKLLQDVMQKDADDSATEKQVKKDKKLVDLMVMQDTCEVDPTKLTEGDFEDDSLLSVNEIQLTLLVQRFLKHIFNSAEAMPDDLRDVIAHIHNEVERKFPAATQRALSAFVFLRFFNCAIAIPEAYGLLKDPPNERVRRSLVLVTKVLTTLASGAHFGDKESFMTQFNDIIDKNQKALLSFYKKICEPVSPDGSKVEEDLKVPAKLLEDSLSVLAASSESLDKKSRPESEPLSD